MRRKIATVCYLIDALKLRVGDEKDKDEADTVGATTLRPEHITFGSNGKTSFNFLGKDSVRWQKEVVLDEVVTKNLQEFIKTSNSSIFKGVRSSNVSAFLGEVMPGLTAKVFRTYHATKAVEKSLAEHKVTSLDPDYVKKHVALMANLQAAIVCNHKRTPPKTWSTSLEKKVERLNIQKSKKTNASKEAARKMKLNIEEMKATRDYNLRTSLKSYIDPRVYYKWGKEIEFDWKLYYPKTLQTKFSWVDQIEEDTKK
jgi:DNA topoisomerase-1